MRLAFALNTIPVFLLPLHAHGAKVDLEEVVYENSWAQIGYGWDDMFGNPDQFNGTCIIECFGQINGVNDTGDEHPVLWVCNTMNNVSSGLRMTNNKGIDALIGWKSFAAR